MWVSPALLATRETLVCVGIYHFQENHGQSQIVFGRIDQEYSGKKQEKVGLTKKEMRDTHYCTGHIAEAALEAWAAQKAYIARSESAACAVCVAEEVADAGKTELAGAGLGNRNKASAQTHSWGYMCLGGASPLLPVCN